MIRQSRLYAPAVQSQAAGIQLNLLDRFVFQIPEKEDFARGKYVARALASFVSPSPCPRFQAPLLVVCCFHGPLYHHREGVRLPSPCCKCRRRAGEHFWCLFG